MKTLFVITTTLTTGIDTKAESERTLQLGTNFKELYSWLAYHSIRDGDEEKLFYRGWFLPILWGLRREKRES